MQRAARVPGLDRLRALAVLAMVFHHLVDWLTGRARLLFGGSEHLAVTDVAAPAFFLVAGASVRLFALSRGGRPHRAVLRRYGLLVPMGMVLGALVLDGWLTFGVLEAIGVSVVVAYAVGTVLRPPALAVAGVVCVVANEMVAGWAHRYGDGHVVREVLDGSFPLVLYVGFTLLGAAAVPLLGRRWAPAAAAGAGAAVVAATFLWAHAAGVEVHRYPGEPPFALVGVGGTLVAFGALSLAPVRAGSPAGRVLAGAGAHALGIFWGHYLALPLIREAGLARDVPAGVAVPVALVVTVAVALVAPRVPQPPWTPRLGWRRLPAPEAPGEVVVHHPDGLHEGVGDRRADEPEPVAP